MATGSSTTWSPRQCWSLSVMVSGSSQPSSMSCWVEYPTAWQTSSKSAPLLQVSIRVCVHSELHSWTVCQMFCPGQMGATQLLTQSKQLRLVQHAVHCSAVNIVATPVQIPNCQDTGCNNICLRIELTWPQTRLAQMSLACDTKVVLLWKSLMSGKVVLQASTCPKALSWAEGCATRLKLYCQLCMCIMFCSGQSFSSCWKARHAHL